MAAFRLAAHSEAVIRPACCKAVASASTSACQGSWNLRGLARLKVALPKVEIHFVVAGRFRPPKFPRGERHGVKMLRTFSTAHRVAVGEDMGAMAKVNLAAPAASIAG